MQPAPMLPQLVALLAAISYGLSFIIARRGLPHSTPITVTVVSLAVQSVTLWTAAFVGGLPQVVPLAVLLFIIAGILQAAIRLFTYTGVDKIGASRSGPLRATHPLWSLILAVLFLREEPSIRVLTGTSLVVVGIFFLSWQPGERAVDHRWWHVLFPLGAAFLAGIVYPIRRYALLLSNHPLFFGAVVGIVGLICLLIYLGLPATTQRVVWSRKSLVPFLGAGVFESMGLLLVLFALSFGRVVVVAPLVATLPLWVLAGTVIFLRDLERLNSRTVIGAVCVAAGTIAISLTR